LLNFKKNRPRGVVDTSVLVAGIAAFRDSESQSLVPSARLLRDWIDNGTFTWLINEEIVDEYKAILARRGVRSSLIGAAINLLRFQAEEIPDRTGSNISPDPGDEPFCICAEMGNADFIVTLNAKDFPHHKLRAHVISPSDSIPTTARKRLRAGTTDGTS
jgi:predicted nucleic acid-binding protein